MGIFAKKVLGGFCKVCETDGVVGGLCQNCGYKASSGQLKSPTSMIKAAQSSFIDRHHSHSSEHALGKQFKNQAQSLEDKHDLQHHTSRPVQGTRSKPVATQQPKIAAKPKPIVPKQAKPASKGVIRFFFLGTLIGWFTLTGFLAQSFEHDYGFVPEIGKDGMIGLAAVTFFLWIFSSGGTVRTFLMLMILPATSLLLFAKPFVAPIKYNYDGNWNAFSPTSETHLYFMVPAFILGFFTILHYYGTLMRMIRWFGRKIS